MATLKIIDCNFEEIEEVILDNTIFETLNIINQVTEFICGDLRSEKTDYLAIDFTRNIIEVQVKLA